MEHVKLFTNKNVCSIIILVSYCGCFIADSEIK